MSDDDADDLAPVRTDRRTAAVPYRRGLARPRPSRTTQQLSKRQLALVSPRLGVLQNVPFVIPFETRVAIFRQFVSSDFQRLGLGDATSFSARSRHRAVVRRGNHLAEDAFKQLNGLGAELKKRVEIVFVDEHGIEESGIDGGGLFKELLTSCVLSLVVEPVLPPPAWLADLLLPLLARRLSKEVFNTDRGLWLATSQNELYPNPHAYAREPNQLAWFAFVGRILGKALYQGILVNVKFAGFFLSKVRLSLSLSRSARRRSGRRGLCALALARSGSAGRRTSTTLPASILSSIAASSASRITRATSRT